MAVGARTRSSQPGVARDDVVDDDAALGELDRACPGNRPASATGGAVLTKPQAGDEERDKTEAERSGEGHRAGGYHRRVGAPPGPWLSGRARGAWRRGVGPCVSGASAGGAAAWPASARRCGGGRVGCAGGGRVGAPEPGCRTWRAARPSDVRRDATAGAAAAESRRPLTAAAQWPPAPRSSGPGRSPRASPRRSRFAVQPPAAVARSRRPSRAPPTSSRRPSDIRRSAMSSGHRSSARTRSSGHSVGEPVGGGQVVPPRVERPWR